MLSSTKQLSGYIFADSFCPASQLLVHSSSSQSGDGDGLLKKTVSGVNSNSESELFVDVVPIFEVVWGPAVGVFSHVFEMSESLPLLQLCAYGCRLGIRLSCVLRLNTALETFVNTLTQFATLRRRSTTIYIHSKNVICFQALLAVCQTHGDKLERSWNPVLQCMTQFERLNVFRTDGPGERILGNPSYRKRYSSVELDSSGGGGVYSNNVVQTQAAASFNTDNVVDLSSHHHHPSRGLSMDTSIPIEGGGGPPAFSNEAASDAEFDGGKLFFELFQREMRTERESLDREALHPLFASAVAELNKKLTRDHIIGLQLLSEIDWLDIEKVFSGSAHLSSKSLRNLVDGLVAVGNGEDPVDKAHCLHWLVQVADVNMDCRSHLEWQPLWSAIGGYLASLGSQGGHAQISILAMAYLQQLSPKFLAKPELQDFHSQKDFLGPFEAAISNSPEVPVREFVLRCIEQLVISKVPFLRSGWVTVFSVLAIASHDPCGHIVGMVYNILDYIAKHCIDLVIEADFSSLVLCFILLTNAESLHVAIGSFECLELCCRTLSSGAVDALKQRPPPQATIPPDISSSFIYTQSSLHRCPHYRSACGENTLRNVNKEAATSGPEVDATAALQFAESENYLLKNAGASNEDENDEISKVHHDPLLNLWWGVLEGLARCVCVCVINDGFFYKCTSSSPMLVFTCCTALMM